MIIDEYSFVNSFTIVDWKAIYNIKDYLIYLCKKKMHVTRVKTVFKMFNPIQSQVSSFYNGK